ncbi:hypothetical protein [Sorangium sp. So ce388]|uniref:hypothetical protein n=1 Tax=Sorangium sp. So ce388 TaxID=3133309 RepID=UPI003F5C575C
MRGVGVEAEIDELEVELLALAEAGEEGEEDEQAVGLGNGIAGANAVLLVRLQVAPRRCSQPHIKLMSRSSKTLSR